VVSDRPSIVMIVLDALRADCTPGADESAHLSSLGIRPPRLPALAGLVRGSTVFTQAFACAPYTTACTASLLTGLLPPEHGVRSFSSASLSRGVRTLPAILAEAGYATCAMSDQPQILQPMGLLRDVQTFVPGEEEALSWWDSFAGTPRFLFMHLWDVHKPYGMPAGRTYRSPYPEITAHWRERLRQKQIADPVQSASLDEDVERRQVYDMQYAWEDAQGFRAGLEVYIDGLTTFDQGRLRNLNDALASRHVPDDAIVVVLADHGEGRDFASPRLCHGSTLADDQLHIPLYIRAPGRPGGRPIAAQVSQSDITPTILDLLGLLDRRTAPQTAYSGRSLLPLMEGKPLASRPAYAEFWTLTHAEVAGGPIFDPDLSSILRFRVLRYPERKFFLAGQPFTLTADMETLPPEDIVGIIARNLLGRLERPEDFQHWLPLLQNQALVGSARLQAVVRAVEDSYEYGNLHKYAVYDLRRDPLEQKPLDPRTRPADWAEYQQHLAVMAEIDRCSRPGELLLTNEADEQVILKRLQDLGYIE
jgi:hypothetical protein